MDGFPVFPSLEDVQFLERLGNGLGAGRFKARLGGVDAPVSLLLEHPSHTDRGQFVAWARRLGSVDHPCIPRVVRVEEVLEPAFVAFEFIEGHVVEQALEASSEPMSPLDALSVLLQAAAGVRAAHAAGLTHGALGTRCIVLHPRKGATDAVRVTGWVPCPDPIDAATRAADVRGLGEVLHQLLTRTPAPSEGADSGPFADLRLEWEQARRDLGGLESLTRALLEDTRRPDSVDAVIELVLPFHERLLEQTLVSLNERGTEARAQSEALAEHRTLERELETRLRAVKQWLRSHEAEAARANALHTTLRHEGLRLDNQRLELGLLLDRPLARPMLPQAPTPSRPLTAEVAAITAAPSAEPEAPRDERATLPRGERRSRRGRRRQDRGVSRRMLIGGAAATLAALGLALWWVTETPETPTQPRAESPAPAAPILAEAGRAATSAALGGAALASAPVTAPPAPPTPPEGMVYVPGGLVSTGLGPRQVEAVLAQCRADFGDSPVARACTPEILAAEAEGAPVKVGDFFIDRLEVSQAQWEPCVVARVCEPLKLTWDLQTQAATGVTRAMAEAYCTFRQGRLPTAHEWLRAARGEDGRPFPWGDGLLADDGQHRANAGVYTKGRRTSARSDGHPYVAPVDTFVARGASPFRVANLAGNVKEWTASTDGPDGRNALVLGGGWKSLGHELRLTRREVVKPGDFAADLGLRCVRDRAP